MALLMIPREGAAHPLFARAATDQALEIVLTFGAELDDAARAEVDDVCDRWMQDVDWMGLGGEPRFRGATDGRALRLEVRGFDRPRRPLEALIERLRGSDLDVIELFIALRQIMPDGRLGPPVELDRQLPVQPADTPDLLWARSFASIDDISAHLPTEDPEGMVSVIQLEDGTTLSEERSAPLHIPGVRVVYGLVEVDRKPDTERGKEVLAELRQALDVNFDGRTPRLYNVRGEANTSLDHIEREGRKGYAFAVVRQEMIRLYPGGFRYREHELFYGVADAIGAAGLAPVIHWDRDQVYIVNIWEQ